MTGDGGRQEGVEKKIHWYVAKIHREKKRGESDAEAAIRWLVNAPAAESQNFR